MRVTGVLSVVGFFILQVSGLASAATVHGTSNSDMIRIGLSTPPGGATIVNATGAGTPPSGEEPYVCVGNASSTTWYYIGNGVDNSGRLGEDIIVEGEAATDTIVVYNSTTSIPSGTCAGTWRSINQYGYILDISGEDGADYLYGGSQDTWVYGGAGNDQIYVYSSGGNGYGGTGADIVMGPGSGGQYLYGDEDNGDCVEDTVGGVTTRQYGGSGSGDVINAGSCPAGNGFELRITNGYCLDVYFTSSC